MHGSGGSSEDQDADRELAFKPCVLVTSWRIQLPSACVLQFRVQLKMLNSIYFLTKCFLSKENFMIALHLECAMAVTHCL